MSKELSIFVDESEDRGGEAPYYLLTLVFHDQSDGIEDEIGRYERCLVENGLPDIAFHSEPLLNGHKGYEGLAAIKYAAKENGETYNKFFGGSGNFKKNWLKQARRMAI